MSLQLVTSKKQEPAHRPVPNLKQRRQLRQDRRCFVCGVVIPDREAVYHWALDLLTCQGHCNDRVQQAEYVYDRSSRGRRRSASDVRAILCGARRAGAGGR